MGIRMDTTYVREFIDGYCDRVRVTSRGLKFSTDFGYKRNDSDVHIWIDHHHNRPYEEWNPRNCWKENQSNHTQLLD